MVQGKRSACKTPDADLEWSEAILDLREGCFQGLESADRQMRNSKRRSLTQEAIGGDTRAGSAVESNRSTTIVLVGQHSVGELTANDTRRVKLGAKC